MYIVYVVEYSMEGWCEDGLLVGKDRGNNRTVKYNNTTIICTKYTISKGVITRNIMSAIGSGIGYSLSDNRQSTGKDP